MNFSLIITSLIVTTLFTSCDPSTPTAKKQGLHQTTATVQIFPSPSLPTSQNFLSNQIAILKTGSLIKAATLSAEISPETLSSSLEISPIDGTDLLAITAHHDDEAFSKTIVQALIDAYLSHRQDLQSQSTKSLDDELIAQSAKIQDYHKELTALIQQHGIPHFESNLDSPMRATEKEMFRRARQKLANFEAQRDQLEIQVKKLDEIPEKDLVTYAAGLDLPENQVTYYFTKHREALVQKRTLVAKGTAADDPAIRALEEKAEGAMAYARKEAISLKSVLRTKVELINRQIDRMSEMIDPRQKLADFETQLDQIEIPFRQMGEITDDDLVALAAGLDLPENQVTYYFTKHRETLEQKSILLAEGRAANHPDIRALDQKAEEAMENARKEAVSLKAILNTKLKLIKPEIDHLRKMVSDREKGSLDFHQRQQKYTNAKETYEQARKVLRELEIKKQEAQLLLKQPHKLLIIHGWDHQ